MKDILSMLDGMRRPQLLIRAARIGAQSYDRKQQLGRLLGYGPLPRTAAALVQLMDLESELDSRRTECRADYSVSRHVEVLAALMAEASLMRAARLEGAPQVDLVS